MSGGRENPVLIVTGPPGVGKSTVAGLLAARWPRSVHLESDAFFRFIRTDYVEPWRPESHPQNEVVMEIVARAAAGYAAAGYRTIIDGIVIPGWFFEPLRDGLRDAGHPVAFAVLRAPLSVCTARVRSREGIDEIDSDALAQIWRSFEELGELERHVIDLDGKEPSEAVDLLERRFEDGLLTA